MVIETQAMSLRRRGAITQALCISMLFIETYLHHSFTG